MKRKIINGIYGAASAAVAVLLGMVILGQEAFVRYETVITVSLADRAYFILMAACRSHGASGSCGLQLQ